jgi:hypothetical protein
MSGADIRKEVFGDTHEVYLAGQPAAQVRHVGFLGDRYEIDTGFGPLTARGSFGGNDTLDQGGAPVASMARQFSLREKFAIDIADGQNDALVLAVMLAVEAIHDRRRRRRSLCGRPRATSAAAWLGLAAPAQRRGVTAPDRAAAVRGPDPGHPG